MAIRVVLAEDNLLVCEGVRRLLETRKDTSIVVVASAVTWTGCCPRSMRSSRTSW